MIQLVWLLCCYAFIAASAVNNVVFASSLGVDHAIGGITFSTLWIWVTISATADILKALSPVYLRDALRGRQYSRAGAAFIVMLLTVSWSAVASLRAIETDAARRLAPFTADQEQRARAQADYTAADVSLAALAASPASAAAIASEIAAALSDRRLGGCVRINNDLRRQRCPAVNELRNKLETVKRRDELQHTKDRARARLDGQAVEPVAAMSIASLPAPLDRLIPSYLPMVLLELVSWLGLLAIGSKPKQVIAPSANAVVAVIDDAIAGKQVPGLTVTGSSVAGSLRSFASAAGVSVAAVSLLIDEAVTTMDISAVKTRGGTTLTRLSHSPSRRPGFGFFRVAA
jgi:hypothetical protein